MYIRQIEIKNFRGSDFSWKLNRDVNVLIGINGSGKSTLLRMIHEAIRPKDNEINLRVFDPIDQLIIELEAGVVIIVDSNERSITGIQEDTDYSLNVNFVNTFDIVFKNYMPSRTILDQQLDQLRQEFIVYQRDLLEQVEKVLTADKEENKIEDIIKVYAAKHTFIKILSELFGQTGKKFDEKNFCFLKKDGETPISPENLSSGEKQILIIMLTVLLQHQKSCILLMDEPEISLHIDWQRSLIQNIRNINPNCQIIMVTHSPTTFYQGWIEGVTRIEEIQKISNSITESDILENKFEQSDQQIQEIKHSFDGFSGSKLAKLYQFNRKISNYTLFTKEECLTLLDFLYDEKRIFPDVITFTTLIAKLHNYQDAKEIFDLILKEKYSRLTHVKPNEITLNILIKKVSDVKEGINLIEELISQEDLGIYPDIITFSTLLGKAKNLEEIKLLEEVRNYYGVPVNEIYLNKLNAKR